MEENYPTEDQDDRKTDLNTESNNMIQFQKDLKTEEGDAEEANYHPQNYIKYDQNFTDFTQAQQVRPKTGSVINI
jgi:hypothetical protein